MDMPNLSLVTFLGKVIAKKNDYIKHSNSILAGIDHLEQN